jgi:hypothetical protein
MERMQVSNEKPVLLEVFRGNADKGGKVVPVRRVGRCNFYPSSGNHVIHIDLFMGQAFTFYLKPSQDTATGEMRICVREQFKQEPGRYFYRQVGIARLCDEPNENLVGLEWDFLGNTNIYMRTLEPTETKQVEAEKLTA